jgi:hypothetical protein
MEKFNGKWEEEILIISSGINDFSSFCPKINNKYLNII